MPKTKKILVVAIVILVIGAITVIVTTWVSRPRVGQRQVLDDGSLLELNRVVVDSHIKFTHGTHLAKLLGNFVPSNGLHVLKLNMERRTEQTFDSIDKSWLVAEFRLSGPHATNHPLANPAFFREFRFVLYGENSIEFVEELWGGKFQAYPDGYYGYIVTSRFPRDSRWLGVRVERRQNQNQGGPWKKVADLKIRNPARTVVQPWVADTVASVKSVGGLDLSLGKVTVETIPYMERDIWNHLVTVPLEVRSNGVLQTNWSASHGYVRVEDASGNWDLLASHRSLDPRYVWKLDADFEPYTNFSSANLATIKLPPGSTFTITTNVMDVPVTISWDGHWLDATIATNQPGIGLRYVNAANDRGEIGYLPSGSWSQYRFRKGGFMTLRNGVMTSAFRPTQVTVAVVPNVHATFFTQPQLIIQPGKN